MKHSEATNEISAALAKAQGALTNPTKDKKADIKSDKGTYSYTYATLADGLGAIREALSANGLALVQATRLQGDVMMLDTRLVHSSDQWFECEWPVCKLPSPPQQIGSALTYARRYSLFALVGIAGEDDDGAAASAVPPAPPKKAPEPTISMDQAKEIAALIRGIGGQPRAFLEYYGLAKMTDLPLAKYQDAIDWINEATPEPRPEPPNEPPAPTKG